ncbi:MAG: TIR domain-containing protein, partial [Anaerolineae bacterium]
MSEHVFISYAHENLAFVEGLAAQLEGKGIKVWYDRDLRPGRPWSLELERRIREAQAMLVVLTPESVASNYVRKEIHYASEIAKVPIVPLMVRACDPPLPLVDLQYVDFQEKDNLPLLLKALQAPETIRRLPPHIPDLFPPLQHLIGHGEERDRLCALHDTVVERGRGKVVFITSRPGYGRRALARSVARYAWARESAVLIGRFWLTGRLSTEQVETLWREDPQMGPPLARFGEKLAQSWPQALRLAGLPWLSLLAQASQELDYAPSPAEQSLPDDPLALGPVLRHIARQRPLVLVLENLDYAPPLWIDLLKRLTTEITLDLPVLLIATIESPHPLAGVPKAERTEALWLAHTLEKQKQAEVLWLGPVSEAEVAAYIGPAVPDLAPRLHYLGGGMPVLVESLWQQWVKAGAVFQEDGQWKVRRKERWWVFGEAWDTAFRLLDACLPPDAPYDRETVETILHYAALEGNTFTAQAIARVLNLDPDDLMDFLDDCLVAGEKGEGLLTEAGFVEIKDVGGPRYLNLYRFARPYLWHVWAKYIPETLQVEYQRRLADALETLYYPEADKIASTLIPLFEATGQNHRAEPYLRRRQFAASLEILRWQVAMLERTTTEGFERFHLFNLLLELSGKLHEAALWQEGYERAAQALQMARAWKDEEREAQALNLAGLNLHLGAQYKQARAAFERALRIFEKHLGPEHPNVATLVNNLG